MKLEGRQNRQPYTKAKFKKILSSWHIYGLTLLYVYVTSFPYMLFPMGRGGDASLTDHQLLQQRRLRSRTSLRTVSQRFQGSQVHYFTNQRLANWHLCGSSGYHALLCLALRFRSKGQEVAIYCVWRSTYSFRYASQSLILVLTNGDF